MQQFASFIPSFVPRCSQLCITKIWKNFKFSTNRDSDSNKWLDAVWLHCRDTPLLVRHSCTSAQYHSRSTPDSTPPTWPFDTLETCKQAGKMAPWWGGPRACLCFRLSYNKTRFLYPCCIHHLEVSHFRYSCLSRCHRPSKQNPCLNHPDRFLFYKCSIGLLIKLFIVQVNNAIIQMFGTVSLFIYAQYWPVVDKVVRFWTIAEFDEGIKQSLID